MRLRIFYCILGGHIHCRVFINSGLCGALTFTEKEFDELKKAMIQRSDAGLQYEFIEELR